MVLGCEYEVSVQGDYACSAKQGFWSRVFDLRWGPVLITASLFKEVSANCFTYKFLLVSSAFPWFLRCFGVWDVASGYSNLSFFLSELSFFASIYVV